MTTPLHVVTGAFGYSGKYITQRLIDRGMRVRTLTNSPRRDNPFAETLDVHEYNFDRPDRLRTSLEGAEVLYNTYWVRFNHRMFTQSDAVQNTLRLFEAAQEAGVKRVVHVSITKPSMDSDLEYFRSKALLEEALESSGLSFAILRPAVLFGHEDILVNNIAWTLRHLPIFGVFGDGQYRIQPMHVDDFADLAVALAEQRDNVIVNAVGPETFTFRGLVEKLRDILGVYRPIVSVPPEVGYWGVSLVGKMVGDVILTREEIKGLMDDLLAVETPSTGTTVLTEWARQHRDTLGHHYASELARRKDREKAYGRL
jgi:NADH dehydrogenase